jgi:peptidoglycan/LPS O-acetylase OafA/YrhL
MSHTATSNTPVDSECLDFLGQTAPDLVSGIDADVVRRLARNNFDLLRLIFAAMVVVYHMGVLTQAPSLSWMQQWVSGTFGLQGFFVVSGFLVSMSYDRSRSLLSYARKRARRIAPAYVTVVLGAAVLFVTLSRLPLASYFADPEWRSYVLWNLLLANFTAPDLPGVFEGNYKQAVNGSLWTIKIEVAFYCMVPVCAYLCGRLGKWRVMFFLLVASLAWRIGFELFARMIDNGFWSKLAIQAPGQFAFFIAGTIAYERTRLGLPPPRLWMALAAAAAYALSNDLVHELVAPLAVGAIVYWAAITMPYLGRASRYGDFSYGVYLYHWPVLQTFIALGLFAYAPVPAALATFATVFALAVCSWYLLERRFLAGPDNTRAGLSTNKTCVPGNPI